MPHLALGRLARYSISASNLGFDPDRLVRDPLGVGLGLSDQRREPRAQVLCGRLVEAVVDLAGIDQIVALAPADIEAVPFVAVEREAGDRSASRAERRFS